LLSEVTTTWNQEITVPAGNDGPIWCEIEISPSLWGYVRQGIYRPPTALLLTTEDNGTTTGYRITPQAGRSGFLVAPHLLSNHDIARFQREGLGFRRLETLRFEPETRGFAGVDAPIVVRFFEVAPLTQNSEVVSADTAVLFRTFSHLPTRHEAMYAIANITEADREVVSAHPPSVIEFDRPSGSERLTGRFAFFSNAYGEERISDGVTFRVLWRDARGNPSPLMERTLYPATKWQDRQVQPFDITLPPGAGKVTLETDPGPAFDLSYDWVYWQDVKFEPAAEPRPTQDD
jgi:hypothetical protein